MPQAELVNFCHLNAEQTSFQNKTHSHLVLCKQPLIGSHKHKKQNKMRLGRVSTCTLLIWLCFFQTPLQGKDLQTQSSAKQNQNCITCIVQFQNQPEKIQLCYLFKIILTINVLCMYDLRPPVFFILISRLAELKDWITR